MLKRKSLLGLGSIALLLLLSNCKCQSNIPLRSVIIELPKEAFGERKKFDQDQVSSLVKKTITKHPRFLIREADPDGGLLKVSLVPAQDPQSSAMVFATLSDLARSPGKEYKSFADIKSRAGSVDSNSLALAIDKVLNNLHQIHNGLIGDHNDYLLKIEKAARGETIPQGELLDAIAVVGDVQEERALKPLIDLLAKSDLAVGNACVISLGSLGKAEAMQPIIDFVERKPSIIRRQAIIAARHIASKLAAEWLLVMAYGYDDPIARKEAMEALLVVEEKLSLWH